MPPEEPGCVMAVRLEVQNDTCRYTGERVFAWGNAAVTTTWYTTSQTPSGYESVLDGLVFVRTQTVQDRSPMEGKLSRRVDGFAWKDTAPPDGLMLAVLLPEGMSITNPCPPVEEAKAVGQRVAVYWLLKAPAANDKRVEVRFGLAPLARAVSEEALRLNRESELAKHRPVDVPYDVALSFAGEDRGYVEQVAGLLRERGVSVFYDRFEEAEMWGKDLYTFLSDLYHQRARFTVVFISKFYVQKRWTTHERKAAQAKAFNQNDEYILPVRFDDTEIPGVLPTTAYVDARNRSPQDLAALVLAKLASHRG